MYYDYICDETKRHCLKFIIIVIEHHKHPKLHRQTIAFTASISFAFKWKCSHEPPSIFWWSKVYRAVMLFFKLFNFKTLC